MKTEFFQIQKPKSQKNKRKTKITDKEN